MRIRPALALALALLGAVSCATGGVFDAAAIERMKIVTAGEPKYFEPSRCSDIGTCRRTCPDLGDERTAVDDDGLRACLDLATTLPNDDDQREALQLYTALCRRNVKTACTAAGRIYRTRGAPNEALAHFYAGCDVRNVDACKEGRYLPSEVTSEYLKLESERMRYTACEAGHQEYCRADSWKYRELEARKKRPTTASKPPPKPAPPNPSPTPPAPREPDLGTALAGLGGKGGVNSPCEDRLQARIDDANRWCAERPYLTGCEHDKVKEYVKQFFLDNPNCRYLAR